MSNELIDQAIADGDYARAVDLQKTVIDLLKKDIVKVREANDFIKTENTKLSDRLSEEREARKNFEAKWQMVSMERDSIEEDLTRFKNLIDFLQRYVLDEI
jgi:regulator of replication initiation timing